MRHLVAGLVLVAALAACGSDSPSQSRPDLGHLKARGSPRRPNSNSNSTANSTASAATDKLLVVEWTPPPRLPTTPRRTVAAQAVEVLDAAGTGKLKSAAFDTEGEWEIRGDVGRPATCSSRSTGRNGEQIDSLHFSSPGACHRSTRAAPVAHCRSRAWTRTWSTDPMLPPPAFHVVVTDLVG